MTRALVLAYLAAIVAANLLTARYGPGVSIVNALVLIGLDITARDRLHEAWREHRARNLAALIVTGSAISFLLNAGTVAVASCAAFALAATVDTIVFHALRRTSWHTKTNGSNIVSAAVDSIAFPTIAFGALMPLVVLGQFAAKVGGGFAWSLLLGARR